MLSNGWFGRPPVSASVATDEETMCMWFMKLWPMVKGIFVVYGIICIGIGVWKIVIIEEFGVKVPYYLTIFQTRWYALRTGTIINVTK